MKKLIYSVLCLGLFAFLLLYLRRKREHAVTTPDQYEQSCSSSFQHITSRLAESVAIIYDYSTITPTKLKEDVNILRTSLNQPLISKLILVENNCENKETSAAAVDLARQDSRTKVIVIEAEQTVSRGRSRIVAMEGVTAPFVLFVSSGSLPDSEMFLENMLETMKGGSLIVVPSKRGASASYDTVSWSLRLRRQVIPQPTHESQGLHLPLIDNEIFLIRSDMYEAVGGYDSFFYKRDGADGLALSLAVWLCGGTVVRCECAFSQPLPAAEASKELVTYLQHAKYIQHVFGGSLKQQITYPGIELYKPSSYDLHAIAKRKRTFQQRSCMTMEWYARKFNGSLPVGSTISKFYNPNYKASLPVFEKRSPHIGKWLVLFAGNCVKVSEDSVLGLSWCPSTLTDAYRFEWKDGLIKTTAGDCVTLRATDSYLVAGHCHGNSTQHFVYDKKSRYVIAKHNGQCVTHFNGDNDRQVLRPLPCEDNSPFNRFILHDEY
ncbi:inactive polypeptide N-acetylgalactosaminyltransferase-like protein 5 [Watersipora subatra]|uniref:inactive polypeptide N-acetylgalactosaminyltransferase-like protein 5 n=1 Tax=Watersipora subatra TaxID=2589382 RepID=UPI00355BA5DB